MTLIQCDKCGKTISDFANICPHCGFSNNEINSEIETSKIMEEYQNDKEGINSVIKFVNLLSILIIFYIVLFFAVPDSRDDFANKFVNTYGGRVSDVKQIIRMDLNYLPLPHMVYYIQYENGRKVELGKGYLFSVHITNSRELKDILYIE